MAKTDWQTVRDALVTSLTGVGITAPISSTLAKVLPAPVRNLGGDFPCVVIMGYRKPDPLRSSGLMEREVIVRLRLIVEDADLDRAVILLDAFQEAIGDRIDDNLTLNGVATNVNGPSWEEGGLLDAGGLEHTASDGFIRITLDDSPTFGG